MKKFLLNAAAVLAFTANAYVLVESAVQLGTVIDQLIAGNFESFLWSIVFLAVYAALGLVLPILAFKIVYHLSFLKMKEIKEKKFVSDLSALEKDVDLSDYSQNIDMLYSGVLLNKWNFFNIAVVFVFTAVRVSALSFALFLIALAASALPLIVPTIIQKSLQKKSSQFLEKSQAYIAFVQDKLGGRRELIRYGGTQWAIGNYKRVSETQEIGRKDFRFHNVLGNVVSEGMGGFGQVIILLAGGLFAFQGTILIGEAVTLLQLMNYLAGPVATMVSLINERVANKPVYEKFQNPDQGQTEKASDDRGNGSDNCIVLRDLALSYGDRALFENLNLCFEKGKSYLITGTSGCGKSSLLKMVAGEMAPSAGEISVFGSRPESYPLVSYVSQDTYIFEDTVRDNITLRKEKSKAEIDALIDFLQLNLDCDEKIDSSREISGGEKKRIGLARAFVTTNEVMLLDEITNGLNHALAMEITKKILALHKTVLFVSHDVSDDFRNLFDGIIDLSGEA